MVSLSGPRFGVTALSEGVVEKLQERQLEVGSTITQFGWQFEKQFYSKQGGIAALHEFVFLVGGLEQGVVLPSLKWMVGLRSSSGAEFGIGPNVTRAGVALALAGGVTFRSGALNVPIKGVEVEIPEAKDRVPPRPEITLCEGSVAVVNGLAFARRQDDGMVIGIYPKKPRSTPPLPPTTTQ